MTPDDRAALLRLIADAIYRHAKGDPDMLSRRILEVRHCRVDHAARLGVGARSARQPLRP
jgi:hypothetical protein